MTARIQDSHRASVFEPELRLEPGQRNFKRLGPVEGAEHLALLADGLERLSRLTEHRDELGGGGEALRGYLARWRETLELMRLEQRFESMQAGGDVRLEFSIDPTDSGFPVFVRDLHFLAGERERAPAALAAMPTDAELVEKALFSLAQGRFPSHVVRQKLERDYFARLAELELPSACVLHAPEHVRHADRAHLYRLSIERLDTHRNLPRFYTLYFKSTVGTADGAGWRTALQEAVAEGFSTVVDLELPYLAEAIERIPGIQLQLIERVEIGPCYGRFTDGGTPFARLLEDAEEGDSIMTCRRHMVQRVGQSVREGLWNLITSIWHRDRHAGHFTPTIASPLYLLMPHRLIQRTHAHAIDLGTDTVMVGTTEGGELI